MYVYYLQYGHLSFNVQLFLKEISFIYQRFLITNVSALIRGLNAIDIISDYKRLNLHLALGRDNINTSEKHTVRDHLNVQKMFLDHYKNSILDNSMWI